jgi:hypothetical protein
LNLALKASILHNLSTSNIHATALGEMAPFGMPTPVLNSFLTTIVGSVRARDGQRVTDLIQLDFESLAPAQQKPYADLNQELNQTFPPPRDEGLVEKCKSSISSDEFGSFSNSFSECVIQYFRYLRDFATIDNQTKATKIRRLTRWFFLCMNMWAQD